MLSNQQHKLCAYRNPEKSKLHQGADGKVTNPMGYDFCDFDQAYIPPGQACSAGDDIKDVIEIFCKKCGKKMCQYKVLPNKKVTDPDAIVDFRYTEYLAAYRPRPDGVLGLECMCGENDTRLSEIEYKKAPQDYPPMIKFSKTDVATAGHKKSDLRYNKSVAKFVIPDRGKHGKIVLPVKGAKP